MRACSLAAVIFMVVGAVSPALAQPSPDGPSDASSGADQAPGEESGIGDQSTVKGAAQTSEAIPQDEFNQAVLRLSQANSKAGIGSPEEAILLRAAQEQKLPEAYYNLGVLYLRHRDLDKASTYFKSALEAAPNYGDAAAQLGVIALARGNNTEATTWFDKAIELDKYSAIARNYFAQKALGEANYNEAIKHGRLALLGEPADPFAYLNIAEAYFRMGNLAVAELVLVYGVGVAPYEPAILNLLGLIYYKRGNIQQAFLFFEKAYNADPSFVDSLKNLAAMELNYKEYDKALKLIDELLVIEPKNDMFLVSRAVALKGLNRLPESQTVLKSVLAVNPGHMEAQYNYCVLAHENMLDFELALTECSKFLKMIDKKHAKYKEMTKRVKNIQINIEELRKMNSTGANTPAPKDNKNPEATPVTPPESDKPVEKPADAPTGDPKDPGTGEK